MMTLFLEVFGALCLQSVVEGLVVVVVVVRGVAVTGLFTTLGSLHALLEAPELREDVSVLLFSLVKFPQTALVRPRPIPSEQLPVRPVPEQVLLEFL